ncbi:MAG: DUF134 domain-containing protein [Puniceicoccaceae bacterium]
MSRPRKQRRCRQFDGDSVFKPRSIPMAELDKIHLAHDELEALRLCDFDQCHQGEAGKRMGVSRGTVFRLLKSARHKVVQAILSSSALVIEKPGQRPPGA